MLLVPDWDQRRLEPAAHGTEPVDTGMAGGAKGNQKPALMDARTAVMNGELTVRPTRPAATTVALEHGIAMSGEAKAGVSLPPVTGRTKARAKEPEAPTRAEKPGLPIPRGSAAGR